MKKCDRCQKKMWAFTVSRMNTDEICERCFGLESEHPRYKEAYELMHNEVMKGNYKYPGLFHGQKWPFGYELTEKKEWVRNND